MGYIKAIKSLASVMKADAALSVYRFLKILSFLTLDFDECQSNQTNGCSQLCINAPGSYSCACQNGYSLNDDKESCDGTYDNTHHYHRQLVIVNNSLVVHYLSVLSIVWPMVLVVKRVSTGPVLIKSRSSI